ncbi:LysR substrate-binding domain-containing protein [Mesorhizobium sp. STM 4661]|uniref:LysR substrate-binding domain-containing protein n=1 Tax=Mesorhizobium sp. STM 4661 TaxID=1297570 RepID=UPI000685026C|nr:LysR substrate-binding domain-containing protein [Mesorhizobium sp. STM 4661]
MPTLRQQLPPLDALVMFDAAARHMSFTLAANELNVTQAAVSRQIRNLEQNLGIRLFIRGHRNVELSPEGRMYQHSVHLALTHIGDATNEIRNVPQATFVVATDQAVAGLWLQRRLPMFFRSNPEISIRLIVSDKEDCLRERVDVAIIHGNGEWLGFKSRLLFPEEIIPVCSPSCIEKYGPVSGPQSLVNFPLIEHEDERWDWMNWRVWLSMNNIEVPQVHHKLLINNYALVIQAAEAGDGVALGWRYVIDDSLKSGRLVSPVNQSVKTKLGYHVVMHEAEHPNPSVEKFCDWVFSIVSV